VKADIETSAGIGKFGLGGKISVVKTHNVFDFYNVLPAGDMLDSSRSNTFAYTEQIRAGYINYTSPPGIKWNMRAGLRVENTVSEGNLTSYHPKPDDIVKRNYVDLFPNGAVSYDPDEKNAFSLSYSRRIDRPNYEDLNPFENKIDELTYQK
jgi:outer membrane receptor protein involved in Fe transport